MAFVDSKSRGAVLVVDDEEDLRSMMRDVLEGEHYVVLEAGDGTDALDILRSGAALSARLVIVDLRMPFMSGWELIARLRCDPEFSSIPILVASGFPIHGDASGVGATMPCIRKPFGADDLVTAVADAIGRTEVVGITPEGP